MEQLHKAVYFFFGNVPDKGGDVGGVVFIIDLVLDQETDAVDHIGIAGIAHLLAQPDHGCRRGVILRCKLPYAALTAIFCGFQHRMKKLLLIGVQMVLIRQFVKVVFHVSLRFVNQKMACFHEVYVESIVLSTCISMYPTRKRNMFRLL